MKKRLISMIMCMMLGVLLLGCSGEKDEGSEKADSSEQESGAEQTIDKDFSLQMTDSYTFTDPQDIDFDERYVLVGDENSKLLSDMSKMGYAASKIYDIVYANGGSPAAEYQYFVAQDEAGATALAEFYTSQGQQMTQEGNVLFAFVDGDTLEGSIVMMASTGALTDETVEAYVEMMKSFNGLVDYE
ncbi:MAG: hypothetical protein K1W34_13550 [Lachnospiraceae bacterium]